MKITYVSHAALVIEVDSIKIVTDPWVKGSSYCDQWYLFPKPINSELIQDADVVLYSHGHEDHLHASSLSTIQKNATIYYPYSWYDGTKEFFNELGFKNVKEIINERTSIISTSVKVTYLSNNLDNVIVIESGDTVIVNVNDALPSASQEMIAHFIEKIKNKWPKIDYVFSSYGGASYFPNTVHFENKNDQEIAETRELFFITNFCKIIEGLHPKYAVPFATDFILLDENQRWINDTKFSRSKIQAFYSNYTNNQSTVEIIEAYSGDYFENKMFFNASPYHAKISKQNLLETIEEDYKEEIEFKQNLKKLNDEELNQLIEKVKSHIEDKKYIIPETIRQKIKFAIKITDTVSDKILIINFRDEQSLFSIVNKAEDVDVLIEIKSKTLNYSIDNEWGGDAIVIGYGAEIFIYDENAVALEIENYCVRLLSRYPNTKEYLKRTPFRAIKYLLSDTTKRKNLFNKAIGKHDKVIDYSDKILGKRDLWLNKSKCDVCKACNI